MTALKKIFVLFVVVAFVAVAQDASDDGVDEFMSQAEANRINQEQRTWEAAIPDKFLNISLYELKKRVAKTAPMILKGRVQPDPELEANTIEIGDDENSVKGRLLQQQTAATSFDARTRWPGCVSPVRNQKQCGACWAFSTVEAFEARLCAAGKVSPMLARSAQYLVDCAPNQLGCSGGYPVKAWNFLVSNGAPSDSCYPYKNAKGYCPSKCNNGGAISNTRAKKVTTYRSIAAVKSDLQTYGPITTWMAVYQDLYYYKSGVYQPTTNQLVGYHGVVVVGWGYDNYYGNYWTVQNSWGSSWGEKGYFRIRQGTSQLDIVDHFVSGQV